MQFKKPGKRNKKIIKATLITGLVIAVLCIGFNIWFVSNARSFIKSKVKSKSNGTLNLDISSVSYSFFSNKLKIREADLVSTDSLSTGISYRVKFRQLTINAGSMFSLLFRNSLDLDSIKLHDPVVVVTQLVRHTALNPTKNELTISQQMGKLYNSMLDGFDAFGIRRIKVNNAKITLIDKATPKAEPVTISNIYFNVVNTAGSTEDRDKFVEDEQTVDLFTSDQDIALPGGRLRLAFKKFNLRLLNKRIELDSCTITSIPSDSLKSSYTIFFNRLLLVGVDFGAMYQSNIIRADSVYCENPLFDITINSSPGESKAEKPDPEKILRDLTGDLDLAFVGVKDAGIRIVILGKKKRTLFNSNKDDFEMRGFRVNTDSSSPVVVERFDMLVRDYHLYNEDSTVSYTFDSIHFMNNRIVLNNFLIVTSPNRSNTESRRNIRVPYFALTGLDWYQLIFEENLVANEAVLINPVINYAKKTVSRRRKGNIFQSLESVGELVTLQKLSVINGQINLETGPATSVKLKDANIVLYSKQLQREGSAGLRNALGKLAFSNAVVRMKDLTVEIQNANYTGDVLLHADRVLVKGKDQQADVVANDVYIKNLLVDEDAERIVVDGVKWRSANIQLRTVPEKVKRSGKQNSNIRLTNIAGLNTALTYINGRETITSFIESVRVASLVKTGNSLPQVQGLVVKGRSLSMSGGATDIQAESYQVASDELSVISGLDIFHVKEQDTLSLKTERISFRADMNAMLANDIHLVQLDLLRPVIKMEKWNVDTGTASANGTMHLRIDKITAREPDIIYSAHRTDSVMTIRVPAMNTGLIGAEGLVVRGGNISLRSLTMNTTSASLVKRSGETIGVETGEVDLNLSNILIGRKDNKLAWSALVNTLHLKNPQNFILGSNNRLLFNEASLGNLNLSSDYINDTKELIRYNVSAWLHTATGEYRDSLKTFKWKNAAYDFGKKSFTLDSFSLQPTQSVDSVMAKTSFQRDYISFSSGQVRLTGFNMDLYNADSSLVADSMVVMNPTFNIYRDKLPPYVTRAEKPLPVELIRLINSPVKVNKLKLVDGFLSYTEKHAKTRMEGTLLLTHINAELSNIKNQQIRATDSLTLTVSAYLMDSSLVRLVVKESYLDTLSGFLMTLKITPTRFALLNPVLIPMSNVKITSGVIDSLQLRAIGHDNLAIGEMKMYYHDLRIRLIKDGDEKKSGLLRNVGTFLVNTFLIRKNNKGRPGIVYYERQKDRSFFNYIVKMTFSGMATSIGVKKNRKVLKQYKRELKEQNLPPIDFK